MSNKTNPLDGVRVTSVCRPKQSRGHDMRIPGYVDNQKYHIDFSRRHITILDFGTPEQAYDKIFGSSIQNYNNSQKRKDRYITDYLSKVINDERKGIHKSITANPERKPFYQFIHYLGNRDFHCPDDKAERILSLFVTKVMPKKYPNFISTNINGHGDEYSYDRKGVRKESPFHIHQTGVFVAHALTKEELKQEKEYREKCKELKKKELAEKGIPWNEESWKKKDWRRGMVERWGKSLEKGMELQTSLSAALAEMGFYTESGKGTAQQQFEESVRHELMDFAESMGVKINRTKGYSHKHDDTDIYSQKENNLAFEKELKEREEELNAKEILLQNKIDDFDYDVEHLEERENKILLDEKKLSLENEQLQIKKTEIVFNLEEIQKRERDISENKDRLERKDLDLKKKEEDLAFKDNILNYKEKRQEEREKRIREGEIPLIKRELEIKQKEIEINELSAQINLLNEQTEIKQKALADKETELADKESFVNNNMKTILEYKESGERDRKEAERLYSENKNQIDAFNSEYNKKINTYSEWEIAEKAIENIQPEKWVENLYEESKTHKNISRFLKAISDGVKGFVIEVKKSYDKILHGHRHFYEDKNGKPVCEYSFGSQDFTEMLLDTPVEDIQKAINECKIKNKKTFREQADSEEGFSFFERYFKRAKEIKREIEMKLSRNRVYER